MFKTKDGRISLISKYHVYFQGCSLWVSAETLVLPTMSKIMIVPAMIMMIILLLLLIVIMMLLVMTTSQ